jgi:hypothetical protein
VRCLPTDLSGQPPQQQRRRRRVSAAEPAPALTLEISRGKDGSVLDIALWRGAAFVASIPVGGDFAETDLHRTGRQSLDEAQVALAHKFLAAEAMYAAIGAFLEAHAAVLGAMAPVMLPGDLDRLDTALAAQQIAIWNLTAAFEKANVGGSSGGGGESAPPPVPEATPETASTVLSALSRDRHGAVSSVPRFRPGTGPAVPPEPPEPGKRGRTCLNRSPARKPPPGRKSTSRHANRPTGRHALPPRTNEEAKTCLRDALQRLVETLESSAAENPGDEGSEAGNA